MTETLFGTSSSLSWLVLSRIVNDRGQYLLTDIFSCPMIQIVSATISHLLSTAEFRLVDFQEGQSPCPERLPVMWLGVLQSLSVQTTRVTNDSGSSTTSSFTRRNQRLVSSLNYIWSWKPQSLTSDRNQCSGLFWNRCFHIWGLPLESDTSSELHLTEGVSTGLQL